MISRFSKIDNDIYRGSAPAPEDVKFLKDKYEINKIISLDQASGDKISRACKLLQIKQIMIPLDGTTASLINLMKYNIKDLLKNGGPTYLHCRHGSDRTGLVAGLYECKYLGVDPEIAIKHAKKLGFGLNCSPEFMQMYEKIIRSAKPEKISKDENNADIVSNEREYKSDNRSSYLDEAHQGSFAPYLGTRVWPYDNVYNSINDQSPTKDNYDQSINLNNNEENVPLVGQYNNNTGGGGLGYVLNPGGFIYD